RVGPGALLGALLPARGAGAGGAGRSRSRDRGAADGLRDPGDRAGPALATLHSPRLDPRPALLMLPVVEVAGVRVARGGRTVLDVAARDVRQGEILAVIGPNGAG